MSHRSQASTTATSRQPEPAIRKHLRTALKSTSSIRAMTQTRSKPQESFRDRQRRGRDRAQSSDSDAAPHLSSAAGLTIEIGGKSMDILKAQSAVARLLRALQKQNLLRIARALGHWKNYDQYQGIAERTGVMVATRQLRFLFLPPFKKCVI